jgi:hypothetical protein
MFCNKIHFYGAELLLPRPTHKLEDHSLSAVRNCLLSIFAASLHIGGRSSILNLRTHHAMVTGSHLSQDCRILCHVNLQMCNNVISLCKSATYILFYCGKLFPNFSLYHIVGVTCSAVGCTPVSSSYGKLCSNPSLYQSVLNWDLQFQPQRSWHDRDKFSNSDFCEIQAVLKFRRILNVFLIP